MLSYNISKKHGEEGLPADTIQSGFKASAGQIFGTFLDPRITFGRPGDVTESVGKGR